MAWNKMKLRHPIVQYFYELQITILDRGTD
jgi:hypothetical protein